MLGQTADGLSAIDGIAHRFFGRTGGTSPAPWRGLNTSFDVSDSPARVEENLARVRFQLGVGRRALYAAKQVHGATVVEVKLGDDPEEVARTNADAMVTTAPELALGVRTADCAPILLSTADGSAIAVAHAGWRGAVGGVIDAVVEALVGVGSDRGQLIAAVGPCIGLDKFEVGPEVIEAAAAALADEAQLSALTRRGQGDRHHLDLAGLVVALLARAGVERVDTVGSCTATSLDLWFSHRAEAGRTGRQMSAIARTRSPVLDESAFA